MPTRPPSFRRPRLAAPSVNDGRPAAKDRDRRSASARGYDRAWQRLRRAKLAADPLCECEGCQAGVVRITPAQVVDHVRSVRERPDLRLDWSNLRSMAKRCHDRRTAREQAFGRGGAVETVSTRKR